MPLENSGSANRVLITEDEALIAMDLERTLRDAGYEIGGLAASCESAYKLLESTRIDFAVLDINLGETKVFPLARKLRERGIPFMFLSAYSGEGVLPEEFKDCMCLEKPISDTLLLRTAALLLENALGPKNQ